MKIRPKKWEEYQHYKHRNPPWIRLHKKLLDDFDFQCLHDASKVLALCLWLIASEYQDGEINLTVRQLLFRLRIDEAKFFASLKELESQGFMFVEYDENTPCYHDASTMLAPCYHDATTETETETETYKVKTQGAKNQKAPPRSASLIELPDFISGESWFAFLDMRKKIRKPATDRACQLLIKKLTMFHNAGHDANAILDQSTVSGWQDLYELKTDYQQNRNGNTIKTIEQIKMDRTKQAMRDFVGGYDAGTGQETVRLVDG